jgi:drug/metabolite transporter (DMT)-like permease
MINGIIYPIVLSAISGFKNIITKSYFLDFIEATSQNNSSMFFMFYKHFFKSIIYTIIALIAYLLFKDNYLQKSEKAIKSYPHLIKFIILFGIIEIALGFLFYKSLANNALNKYIIYYVVFTVIINGVIAHLIYNEKITIRLLIGYIICIIGILIVRSG